MLAIFYGLAADSVAAGRILKIKGPVGIVFLGICLFSINRQDHQAEGISPASGKGKTLHLLHGLFQILFIRAYFPA